jgi:hypothetical protein
MSAQLTGVNYSELHSSHPHRKTNPLFVFLFFFRFNYSAHVISVSCEKNKPQIVCSFLYFLLLAYYSYVSEKVKIKRYCVEKYATSKKVVISLISVTCLSGMGNTSRLEILRQ